MSGLVEKTTHVDEALANLPEQFKGKANFTALLTAIVDEVQELEGVLLDVFEMSWLDNAADAQLDVIGVLVGEDRKNRDDDTYRLFIRVRILLNTCSGTPDQILAVFALLIGAANTLALSEHFPAAFVLEVGGSTVTTSGLLSVLRSAKPAGVNAQLVTSEVEPEADFLFADSTSEAVSTTQGFDTTSGDSGEGGSLAAAQE